MRPLLLLFGFIVCFSKSSLALINPTTGASPFQSTVWEKISSMKVRDIQKKLGRKLSLKERIGFSVLKNKMKRAKKNAERDGSAGNRSLIFGILGVGLFLAGFALPILWLPSLIAGILAITNGSKARSIDPEDTNGKVGKILGWITVGLIAALAILIVVLLATWDWGGWG